MPKYNIIEIKEKEARYRYFVSPETMDRFQDQIMNIIVMQKKYLDKYYSAKQLAQDLGTNTRYISAIMITRFHMNFTSFVNSYRINDAKSILVDKRYQDVGMKEVAEMAGFANRQTFYASFYRFTGITPREWRITNLRQHPSMVAKKK
jgi:AraC-like DNA-binding protein